MLLLVIGGVNWGILAVTGTNAIQYITGKNTLIANAIFLFVGIAALFLGFARDSYLPFLGPAVLPCSLLKVQTPEGADYEKRVLVKPGVKVMYWAAEPATERLSDIHDWRKAYLKFMNAGCARANDYGVAVLLVRNPQPYSVPLKGRLEPHVHYRSCGDGGMMSRIETVFLSKGKSV